MDLNKEEKKVFILLMLSSFFNGAILSTFLTQDIIAKKALGAQDIQITFLVMLWPLSNLLSIWWGKAFEYSKSLSKFFIFAAIFGRLVLLLMLFVKDYPSYLIIMVLVFSFNSLISPAQNIILQNKFRPRNRGLIFGYTASIITIVMILVTYITGKYLDVNGNYFRMFFAFVAIMGFLSMIVLAFIKVDKKSSPYEVISFNKIFIQPVSRMIELLKKDRDFFLFQINFMIYGFAYMIILPAIPKYLVDYIGLDYSKTFIGKAILSQLGILILAPLAGKIHDKKSPPNFTMYVFAILSLYPITLLISTFYIGQAFNLYIIYLAFFLFGVGMAGMVIAWNISSLYFAGSQDVSMYQSTHVTLTGLRGIFAPMTGLFIMKILGIRALFSVAAIVFLIAAYFSWLLHKKMKRDKIAII